MSTDTVLFLYEGRRTNHWLKFSASGQSCFSVVEGYLILAPAYTEESIYIPRAYFVVPYIE